MAKARWRFGLPSAQVPSDVSKPVPVPALASADAKKFGLENVCDVSPVLLIALTAMERAVLQQLALYFCTPFRDLMLQSPDPSLAASPPFAPSPSPGPGSSSPAPLVPVRRKPERKPSTTATADLHPPVAPIPSSPQSLFSALRSLFFYISTHPAERGTVSPRAFIEKLKEVNQVFNTTTHQDAHEFLNYLLNRIVEEVEEERARERRATPQPDGGELDLSSSMTTLQSKAPTFASSAGPQSTLVHKLFEGVLTSETRCLTCETVSSRDESFLDLSIDIEQNSSVTACLRQFSASEMLCHTNKFFCDSCCDLQEAEKRMKIKRLPNVLALHLKRFKYQEDLGKYVKLAYRVAFPFELRLFNTVDEMDEADRLYSLFGIVVHIGNGPHHGHYVSIVKTLGTWLLFDDDTVSPIPESDIPKYFGDSPAGSAYVLYYQAADIDGGKLGLRTETNNASASNTSTSNANGHHHANGPTRPPGLAPEPISQQRTSESSSELLPSFFPPSSPSISSPAPIPIPSPTSSPIPPLAQALPSLAATASSSSHSMSSSSSISPPPPLPSTSPLPNSPDGSKVAASMNSLLKSIRKSPSISVRTTSAGAALENAAPPATPTVSAPVPVPPTPTTEDRGDRERDNVHSPRQFEFSASVSSAGSGSDGRPATAHATRVLPVPPLQPVRPVTSGGVVVALGGEDELDTRRRGDKEKERGGRNWFGLTQAHGVMSDPALPSVGSGSTVVEEGSEVHLNVSANGSGKKEKGGTWFGGKRKSFRITEKTFKGLVGSSSSSSHTHEDLPPPSPTSEHTTTSWFRNSLQLPPQRRGSESGGSIAPLISLSKSTPAPILRPLSTSLVAALNNGPRTRLNGDITVSPAPSETSSLEYVSTGVSTPMFAVHPHPHPLPRPPSNGHPLPVPPPRIIASTSTPPTPVITPAHAPGFPHTRTLPATPPQLHTSLTVTPIAPIAPVTPERKKSLASFPVFRSRDKDKDKDKEKEKAKEGKGREKEKEKEKVWDSVVEAPSRAGSEREREGTEERPLPPVPVPGPGPVPSSVHESASVDGHGQRHQRPGSTFGAGSANLVEVLEEPNAPGLASFGSANTSVASSNGGGGGGNSGFKRATRKLSLTAPILGFGKKDKEKEKEREKERERERERMKERAVASSFTRM
ncbi:hypothetical protein DXG03_000737 [Asterophora parasitica]|uniref:ubiquitinyl hydrolase 1 n=1 Tax=Asterophora parasitica TaxID=117018 RepID=A0A9P7K9J9_9AGAR|nr:hypothetical protein DXG03_000737 [Asterophora parasitica]